MKQLIKVGARLLYDYAIILIVFIVFLYPFIGLTGESFPKWLPLYSLLLFVLLFLIIYNDMKTLAKKEVKPQYEMNPYPLKGLLHGLISIVPTSIIAFVLSLLHFEDQIADRLRELAIDGLFGPVYFIVAWMNKSIPAYITAILVIPVVAMLGYLAGYYGINIMEKILKKDDTVQEKPFTKSPWNPTLEQKHSGKKKKKKKASSGQ